MLGALASEFSEFTDISRMPGVAGVPYKYQGRPLCEGRPHHPKHHPGKFFRGPPRHGRVASPSGREGPSVQVGGGIASVLGRYLGLSSERVKALIPVGAPAAIAAAFNTPLAAVLFSLKEITGDLHAPILVRDDWLPQPPGLFCGCSWEPPIVSCTQYQLGESCAEFGIYAILGIAGGLVSVVLHESFVENPRMVHDPSEENRLVSACCGWPACWCDSPGFVPQVPESARVTVGRCT